MKDLIIQIAGWSTTLSFAFSFLPQLIQTYKTKKVEDISLGMWIPLVWGYTSGIVYSILLKQPPLIFGYIWQWFCCALFLMMYFKYRKRPTKKRYK